MDTKLYILTGNIDCYLRVLSHFSEAKMMEGPRSECPKVRSSLDDIYEQFKVQQLIYSNDSVGDTPISIPNIEVKPNYADGTRRATSR